MSSTNKTATVVGIIPARYASTRLPGKPLALIRGRPMIQWVYSRVAQSATLRSVCVATDDERIRAVVEGFGGRCLMTSPDHPSGTDRLAEAAARTDADIVVNIQGDQPFLDPAMIDEAVGPMLEDSEVELSTLKYRIRREADWVDPSVVKVVTDRRGFALYFSRSRIPYPQKPVAHEVYKHVGLYAYRLETLYRVARLAPTELEQVESLEQLRWLEHGLKIRVVETRCLDREVSGFSVDTPEDLERANQLAMGLQVP